MAGQQTMEISFYLCGRWWGPGYIQPKLGCESVAKPKMLGVVWLSCPLIHCQFMTILIHYEQATNHISRENKHKYQLPELLNHTGMNKQLTITEPLIIHWPFNSNQTAWSTCSEASKAHPEPSNNHHQHCETMKIIEQIKIIEQPPNNDSQPLSLLTISTLSTMKNHQLHQHALTGRYHRGYLHIATAAATHRPHRELPTRGHATSVGQLDDGARSATGAGPSNDAGLGWDAAQRVPWGRRLNVGGVESMVV